jgi:signal transduction histidine kinase
MGNFIADQIELPSDRRALSHPDANLLALIQRHKEARRVAEDANTACDELGDRLADECPPEAAFGTTARAIRSRYPGAVLARMREFISLNITEAFGLPTEAAIAAADAYEAKIEEARERLGVDQASARLEEADNEQDRLLDEIRDTPSQTLTGIVAKLRVMDLIEPFSAHGGVENIAGDYWLHWKGEMLRDAERLAGLPVTGPHEALVRS